jgi:hypothetical protein
MLMLIDSVEEKESDGVEDLKEEYLKAFKEGDSKRMAAIIKQGLPMEVLMEKHPISSFSAAVNWVAWKDDNVLLDALLSRTDIWDEALKELVYIAIDELAFIDELTFDGSCYLRILQYLEIHGANIKKICFEAESDILIEVLRRYTVRTIFEGDDKCQELCKELCEIIDFFKSKGVDTVNAYMQLAYCRVSGDRFLLIPGDCHDEVAKRLKAKGGRKWKLRG